MKLATLGLATALAFTGTFALAQSGGGSAGGGSATGGAAATGTTTGSSVNGTTTGSSTGVPNSGMSNDAGSAAAGRASGLNPSGSTQYQPVAQRLDPDAGACRQIVRYRKPRVAGLFHSEQFAAAYFFSSSNFLYFSTSRVTSCPSTSGACSLASGATVERS